MDREATTIRATMSVRQIRGELGRRLDGEHNIPAGLIEKEEFIQILLKLQTGA